MLQIHPIRATFSSRSFRSNPRPLHTVVRSASASRTSTRHPRRFSSRPTSAASVVFPAQGSPVNQRVNPPAEPAEGGVPFADIDLLHPKLACLRGDVTTGHRRSRAAPPILIFPCNE